MDTYVGWGWALLVAGCIMAALATYRVFHPRPEGDRFQRRLRVAETSFRGAFGCLLILSGVLLLLRLHVSQATMLALESGAGIVLIVIGCGLAVWARIFARHVARELARDGFHGPLRWPMIATATITFAGLALMSVCGGVMIIVPASSTAALWTDGVIVGVVSGMAGGLGFGATTLLAYHHR